MTRCINVIYRARSSESADFVPHEYMCPLSLDWFEDPVVTASGHSYSRSWLSEHLDHSQSDPLTRMDLTDKIFWLCSKCPAKQEHSWSAWPCSRNCRGKSGCPCCAGQVACQCNSLQALCPSIAVEWDHGKNEGQPSDYTASSSHLAWWSSPQRGSWQQTIHSRTQMLRSAGTSSRCRLRIFPMALAAHMPIVTLCWPPMVTGSMCIILSMHCQSMPYVSSNACCHLMHHVIRPY